MIRKIAFAVLAFSFSYAIHAQTSERFQVIDQTTNMPIEGVNYKAGEIQGTSDESGWIHLGTLTPDTVILSHVSYGKWKVAGAELEQALASGILYRENQAVNLYPVQIIAIHRKQTEPGMIDLDYEDRMTHDGGALLLQDPTISAIRKSAGYGFDPVIRGFKYDQVQIVMNGSQGATAACPNRMDPPTSQMAPNMIDRVEILKGPHALRYGNAVGATINFVTGQPEFPDNRRPYGRISAGYDGNGNVMKSEALLGMRGSKADIGLFGSYSQGDDYTDGNGNTVQADFMRLSVGMNGGFKLGDRQQLRVSVTNNRAKDAEFAALPMDLRSDNTLMMNARHDIVFRDRALRSFNTTVFGSLVDHEMDNLSKNIDPRTMNAVTLASTFNAGGRTEGNWNFERSLLFAGADFRTEGADGERSREFLMGPMAGNTAYDNVWQASRIDKTGVFGEYHYTVGTTQLILSARININHAVSLDADSRFVEVNDAMEVTQVNPGFSMGGKKQLDEMYSAGLWVGRVQRSGSLTEKFINYFPVGLDPYEMVGNPGILPEINNQADLTLGRESDRSLVEVTGFVSYLQNYISSTIDPELSPRLPMSPGVRRFENLDEAFKTGIEIHWAQTLIAGLQHSFTAAYTYGQDLQNNQPLPEIAPFDFRYRLSGSYIRNKLNPEVSFRHVLKQDRISEEFGETETPSFTLVNAKVSYRFHRIMRLAAGVNNLLDVAYFEHLSRSVRGTSDPIYAPGRNIFVSMGIDLD